MLTHYTVHISCIEALFSYTVEQQMNFLTVHTVYNLGMATYSEHVIFISKVG